MNYREFRPSSNLASYIECYWQLWIPLNDEAKCEIIVPGGRVEVMINTGSWLSFQSSNGRSFSLGNNIYVLGQRNTYFTGHFYPGNFLSGIRFRPGLFHCFADCPASCLLNNIVDASDVFRSIETSSWYDEVTTKDNERGKIDVIEKNLLKILMSSKSLNKEFIDMLSRLKDNINNSTIDEFCRKNKIYYKKLERQCLRFLGYTPMDFLRVRRFYQALKLMYNDNVSLTDIGYNSGYFDQSHFIKDFKNFASLSPSKFVSGDYEIPRLLTKSRNV